MKKLSEALKEGGILSFPREIESRWGDLYRQDNRAKMSLNKTLDSEF